MALKPFAKIISKHMTILNLLTFVEGLSFPLRSTAVSLNDNLSISQSGECQRKYVGFSGASV